MVVDCGGGTVDITVYEMESKYGCLKELHKATGGPYGSVGQYTVSLLSMGFVVESEVPSTGELVCGSRKSFAYRGIKHSDFFCFKGVTYVALTLCFKLRSFYIDFF